jgi:carbon monoxide dehydrogenase subunit G
MIEFKGNIAVERSPDDVFAFVADPANRPQYQHNVAGSRVVGAGPVRAGSAFEEVLKLGPWKLRTAGEIVAYEAPRRCVIAARNGMMTYRGEFAVEHAPGGARLTISGRAELVGWRRILQPMLRAECGRNLRQELERIREILVPSPARAKVRPTVTVATAAAFLALALALPLAAGAADAPKAPAPPAERKPPAELKKTVDAFAGTWSYDGTVTMPGAKPVKAPIEMACKKGALGKAVACTFSGNIPGSGPLEASLLVGYDTFHKNVHFMAMTSDEEVHDHVCNWRSATDLVCEPLKGGLMGDEVTEDFSLTFAGDRGSFRSVMKLKDGSQVLFEATGKRKR